MRRKTMDKAKLLGILLISVYIFVAAVATAEQEQGMGTGYAVITTSDVASSSRQLAAFLKCKQLRGFSTHLITESAWGGGTGKDRNLLFPPPNMSKV
jgi:hypothetical protein